jgi:signal transduction histidine kinase
MAGRQTTETIDPDSSSVNEDRAQGIGWHFASILHDLRNPLGTIYAAAELLMDLDSTSIQGKRLAANMFRAAGRMRQLLADLTNVGRDNASTPEICDIREVIAAASEAALAAREHHRVQILLDVPDGINLPLVRSPIERVFFNLIANAFEAMPGGGKVWIGARKASGCVLVELEDTGPGIPRCISDRLFEPFITSGKQDGLGLGLALARRTIRKYCGDMWTEPAAGARFVIRLPLDHIYSVLGRAASSEKVSTAV